MQLSLQLLLSPRALQTLHGYVVVGLEVLYRGVVRVCLRCGAFGDAFGSAGRPASVSSIFLEEIVEKGLSAAGLRMENVVLLPEEIVLAVLEEREEAEEGDVNEEKGVYPTAHREFVERIKENQRKLEEAMVQMVVEALGLSRLRFVKADAEADTDKQH
ncbi:uncharacterized protein MONOS_13138 [Monocercomonoides exilis]|uniref:uncharacterized protein n=1 Tax=Monocercomonoides exilis TaxID=2049356 RepID=UPI003559CAC0|nr:hypothetical protein MONOS_13138 [Monocercomonoides exilis]|eukprot:MONOS_13138.1-p1 / transcript=MONOS_13138.1 / gene=MONOS_13138 / organism=Monocercomonoides_exilis_PA203 / gene_product=unspecified product / transcript_product=unspecified product / location=Mono_scaffold00782:10287-10936(+) / protein_length=159 / sequence_SO=supercontig / SO=protein_coding / is_pseudo=false